MKSNRARSPPLSLTRRSSVSSGSSGISSKLPMWMRGGRPIVSVLPSWYDLCVVASNSVTHLLVFKALKMLKLAYTHPAISKSIPFHPCHPARPLTPLWILLSLRLIKSWTIQPINGPYYFPIPYRPGALPPSPAGLSSVLPTRTRRSKGGWDGSPQRCTLRVRS